MSDAEKEDRKAMEKKMDEMEEKLQVWTIIILNNPQKLNFILLCLFVRQ